MVHCKTFFVISCCFAISYQESFNLELNEKGVSNNISLKFTFNQKEIDLELTLNELVTSKVPVFVGKESNQQLNISYWPNTDTKDFKSYHDPISGASFLVLSDSTVQGIFKYDTREYFIKPFNGRRKKRSANLYTAVEVKMDSFAKPPDRAAKDNTAFNEKVSSFLLEQPGTKMDYVVEVIMFVDFSIYKSWYTLTDQTLEASARHESTIENMKYYYACIANAMDTRYSSIREDDFSIRIKLNGVYIASTESSSPWTRDFMINVLGERVLDVYQAIDNLPEWLKKNAGNFPQHDSVLVFTELSLFAGYSQGRPRFISGLANIKALCNEDAVSFNRDRGEFGTAGTASHELAHNLGSLHDNFQDNNCNPNDQYIMSPAPGELNQLTFMHPFQFSPCSIDYFRRYLATLTYHKKNCLLQTKVDLDVNIPTNILLGQYIKIDQQCQLLYGKESYYCGGHENDKVMCEKLTCYNPIEMQCVTRVDQRAATGTTCGNKKWCDQGKCVSNSQASAASDFCLYGDYRGTDVDCLMLISQDPSKCYQQSYFEKCCAFCEYIKSSDLACPFGDKIPPYCADKVASDCYDDALRTQCCRSCYNFKKTSLQGCEYGNRARWCDAASPSICYGDTSNCCELCAENHVGVSGCEYGDRVSWCNKSVPGHCSSAVVHCCLTCNPSFTKPPKPISIQKFVQTEPPPSPRQSCPSDPSWCTKIPPFYCYLDKSKRLCSCTCSGFQTNIKGCEFGDRHIWCKNVTKNQCQEIENPHYCCSYCSGSNILISQRTNLPYVMVLLAAFFRIIF